MNTPKNTIALLLVLILTLAPVYAGTFTITVTSQPSTLGANQNYALGFTVANTANATTNVTARLFVNAVNVINSTWTNNVTVPGSNSFSTTFSQSYYSEGDRVYVNITAKEAANATATLSGVTNTLTIDKSTNSIIAQDTFSGLPALGTNVSGFLSGLTPGLVALIFAFALIAGIVLVIYAVNKAIMNQFSWKK